jgi:hypothetical protein
LNLFLIFNFYNKLNSKIVVIKTDLILNFFKYSLFLQNYFQLNEIIWQEGLLIDFLQKKITDNWLKKFVIYSANLFNERSLFEKIVKFYLDLVIWPMHKIFIFEFNNVGNTLFITLFFFFFLCMYLYLLLILFIL